MVDTGSIYLRSIRMEEINVSFYARRPRSLEKTYCTSILTQLTQSLDSTRILFSSLSSTCDVASISVQQVKQRGKRVFILGSFHYNSI